MDILDADRKIITVYLSRTGCLAYTKEMIKGFHAKDPLLILSPDNKEQFPDYDKLIFKTYPKVLHMLLHTLFIQTRVAKLMDSLAEKHGDIQLYLPAFHPWNIHFAKWARANSVPCTLTIHDYQTHAGELSVIIEKMQKAAIAVASQVIFLTDYVRQQCITDTGPSEKYKVVPHPLLPSHCINTLPYSMKPSLLFLGRVISYKGLDLLTAAIKNLDIEKLTIAGQQTKLSIASSEKVTVIDKVLTDGEISDLLASHEILVLPYAEASQSGVLTLGIAAEMVMVITEVGGLKEQLDEDAACWVEPSVVGIREGIEKLIGDENYYRNIKASVQLAKKNQLSIS